MTDSHHNANDEAHARRRRFVAPAGFVARAPFPGVLRKRTPNAANVTASLPNISPLHPASTTTVPVESSSRRPIPVPCGASLGRSVGTREPANEARAVQASDPAWVGCLARRRTVRSGPVKPRRANPGVGHPEMHGAQLSVFDHLHPDATTALSTTTSPATTTTQAHESTMAPTASVAPANPSTSAQIGQE